MSRAENSRPSMGLRTDRVGRRRRDQTPLLVHRMAVEFIDLHRLERPGTDLGVIRLNDQTPALRPKLLEGKDEVLESHRRRVAHLAGGHTGQNPLLPATRISVLSSQF